MGPDIKRMNGMCTTNSACAAGVQAPKNRCNGWTPTSPPFNGDGATCGTWKNWANQPYLWCYVDEDYDGCGKEFVKPSIAYEGKFWTQCACHEAVEYREVTGIKWCSGANLNVGDIWDTGTAHSHCPLIGNLGSSVVQKAKDQCDAESSCAGFTYYPKASKPQVCFRTRVYAQPADAGSQSVCYIKPKALEYERVTGIRWCSGANLNVGDIWGTGITHPHCPIVGDLSSVVQLAKVKCDAESSCAGFTYYPVLSTPQVCFRTNVDQMPANTEWTPTNTAVCYKKSEAVFAR